MRTSPLSSSDREFQLNTDAEIATKNVGCAMRTAQSATNPHQRVHGKREHPNPMRIRSIFASVATHHSMRRNALRPTVGRFRSETP
jgi:hypothetical protein